MRFFVGFCAILFFALMIYGIFFAPVDYVGKEVFQTEEAYTDFKTVLADPRVSIREIKTLSSGLPIIVDFSVWVSRDCQFGYGLKGNTNLIFEIASFCCGVGFSVLCIKWRGVSSEMFRIGR